MKKTLIIAIVISAILIIGGIVLAFANNPMNKSEFKSKRIVKAASITLNGNIDEVFPLFGANEEQKWAPTWKPEFIYPPDKKDEKNAVFKVEHSGGHGRPKIVFHWVVTEYSKEQNKIAYVVFSGHSTHTIEIQCNSINDNKTQADIEYVFTSLDQHGSNLIAVMSEKTFSKNLLDWGGSINEYLESLK